MAEQKEEKRGKITLFGISIWKLMAYFILYSILGYIVETLFGIITKGVWECRQSFLYGPFLRDLWDRRSTYLSILILLQEKQF